MPSQSGTLENHATLVIPQDLVLLNFLVVDPLEVPQSKVTKM